MRLNDIDRVVELRRRLAEAQKLTEAISQADTTPAKRIVSLAATDPGQGGRNHLISVPLYEHGATIAKTLVGLLIGELQALGVDVESPETPDPTRAPQPDPRDMKAILDRQTEEKTRLRGIVP